MDVIKIILAAVAAIAAHELGHYISAISMGLHARIKIMKRAIFGIPYPQPYVEIWTKDPSDSITLRQMRVFCVAGFGWEIFVLGYFIAYADLTLRIAYWAVLYFHFITYPFRNAGRNDNDFKWLA